MFCDYNGILLYCHILKFDTQKIYDTIADVYDRECLILELTGKLKTAHENLPVKDGNVLSIKKTKEPVVTPANSILLR